LNLIITCARHLELETKKEISQILKNLGDSNPLICITNMSGILTVKTELEPISVIKKIKKMILDEPWCIRYSLRIIPIQNVTETNIENIENSVSKLIKIIAPSDTYRILIEKRFSEISSTELISKIANKISNKVSLEFPDKIILIEVLGNKTGISVIKNEDILSTEKFKRSISE
jgi:tRNA acetyltransferase TAN1